MPGKTPKFDATIAKILDGLSPHERVCDECGTTFRIEEGDIEFLKKLRVCPPLQCPRCRSRRRLAMMANILQYYRKDCAAHPGEKAISQMDDAIPYKIYDNDFWWDPNAWDAVSFGRPYDPAASFEEQWKKLLLDVPHMAIERFNKSIINSEYTADSFDVKNCYLSSSVGLSENISYSVWVAYGKDCLDCLHVDHIEYSYAVTDSDHIYNCKYVRLSDHCADSVFLFDCHNCENCFGCVNLRSKKYCFFNEQLGKEEYMEKMKTIDLGRRGTVVEYTRRFEEFISERGIYKALRMKNSPRAVGDDLKDCKDCIDVFSAASMKFLLTFYKNENLRHSVDVLGASDSMDVTLFGPGESSYNVLDGLQVNKITCGYFLENCLEMEYCYECVDCKYCFGCSGLKKKKFCILNDQYAEEEYWKTVDEIKTKLAEMGTYGTFLPLRDSFFYYHDTYAYAMMPLSENEARAAGARWRKEEANVDTRGMAAISAADVPDRIDDTGDDILQKAVLCEETGRPFKITPSELAFYRTFRIPVPVVHPQRRTLKRFGLRNFSFELYDTTCVHCGKEIRTSYDSAKNLRVYCENCYQQEVI